METTKRHEAGRASAPSIKGTRSVAEAAECLATSQSGALLVVGGRGAADDEIIGLLTERDICRAVATRGMGVYDLCVWVITNREFPKLDVAASSRERLQAFCARKTNHIVLMDGPAFSGVLNVWDCAQAQVRETEAFPT